MASRTVGRACSQCALSAPRGLVRKPLPPSATTPSAAGFAYRDQLKKNFSADQSEALLKVFPTPDDVASTNDIAGLAQSIKDLERDSKARHEELRLYLFVLALAIGLLTTVSPSSVLGTVLAAFAKGLSKI